MVSIVLLAVRVRNSAKFVVIIQKQRMAFANVKMDSLLIAKHRHVNLVEKHAPHAKTYLNAALVLMGMHLAIRFA